MTLAAQRVWHSAEQRQRPAPVTAVSGNVDDDRAGFRARSRLNWQAAASPSVIKFGREQEADADLTGLLLLQRAKIDPAGMITFFERLSEKDEGRMEWLSTHSMRAVRAQRFYTKIEALPRHQTVLFSFDWRRSRTGSE